MTFYPRLAAIVAVLLWSSGALFVLGLARLSPCLILAITSSITLFFSAIYCALSGRWRLVFSRGRVLIPAGSLILLNQVSYLLAFRAAPAAQVDLINYLWPSMLILLTGQFVGRYTHFLVVACGAGGIMLALDPGALDWSYLFGYILALVAALSWTGYSLLSKKHNLPPEFHCMALGIGVPVYWGLHYFLQEPSLTISSVEGLYLLLYGGGVYGIAYPAWGYAINRGSLAEASALSYLIPLFSVGLLALFAYAQFTLRLAGATSLVLLAAGVPMISTYVARIWTSKAPIGQTG